MKNYLLLKADNAQSHSQYLRGDCGSVCTLTGHCKKVPSTYVVYECCTTRGIKLCCCLYFFIYLLLFKLQLFFCFFIPATISYAYFSFFSTTVIRLILFILKSTHCLLTHIFATQTLHHHVYFLANVLFLDNYSYTKR